MANTLTISLSAAAVQGSYKDSVSAAISVTLGGIGAAEGIQTIGTSAEDLAYGDLASSAVGYCFLRNLDDTNYVTFGKDSTGSLIPIGRLAPGGVALFQIEPSQQVMLQANTAPVQVEYRIWHA